MEEFDENCSTQLGDLASCSSRTQEDQAFAYADPDINHVSAHLGIKWETSKSVLFGMEVLYLGFHWDLWAQCVHLLDEKKARYHTAIMEWEKKHTHNLLETQKLYGKLLHASLVIPAGRAHLTSLEAMLGTFHHNPFLPHTPPQDTPDNLDWWRHQLSHSDVSRPTLPPQPIIDHKAYSDASSGFGMAITVGPKWQVWRLADGWKSQGRDIQWAEAIGIGFELLTICLCSLSGKGEHFTVYGDNWGVVKGWWKKCSANRPTNRVFCCILQLLEDCNRTVYTKYVPSAQNPADCYLWLKRPLFVFV